MIRLFVGCAPDGMDAESQAVLEYSVRRFETEPIEITWMKLSRDPMSPFYSNDGSGWQTRLWATPFSGFRWSLPHLCHFSGKAIYSDSDVIFQAPIKELWDQKIPFGKLALAKGRGSWRYCISVWNCEEAENYFPPIASIKLSTGHQAMSSWMRERPELTASFDGDWNCLDGEGHGDLNSTDLKAIHYTDMSMQPQLIEAMDRLEKRGLRHWYDGPIKAHPRQDLVRLFDNLLEEAVKAGFHPSRYESDPLYGKVDKQTLKNYSGNGR